MTDSSSTADLQLIDAMRGGDHRVLEEFYLEGRVAFCQWAEKNFSIHEVEIVDIYQDAMIILYENVVSGKYISGESSLKTYLYAIAKNLFYKRINKEKKATMLAHELAGDMLYAPEPDDTHRLSAAEAAFAVLKEPCLSILKLFYYQKLSMTEIAINLGYKSDKVVKSQKVRCLKTLREETDKLINTR
jgi:RNA polymerase sigma factor (sigma-70 family)